FLFWIYQCSTERGNKSRNSRAPDEEECAAAGGVQLPCLRVTGSFTLSICTQ
ncbi:Hypothetical protein SMAX5B_006082, partial [Scophthalmus maximus]